MYLIELVSITNVSNISWSRTQILLKKFDISGIPRKTYGQTRGKDSTKGGKKWLWSVRRKLKVTTTAKVTLDLASSIRETRFFCQAARGRAEFSWSEEAGTTSKGRLPRSSRRLVAFVRARTHRRSLVRIRPVLASNDRNGFIVEAQEMKKVNNDRIGVGPWVGDQTRSFAKNACRSSQIAL